ncbi:myc-type, basic helix-loop-helix (bHLH) domain-containing protein [Artemisia annua]|uniref:Myc-type, basic helix-loop-helix (BHLH) domain-containing protein n=1 Tax=Artemisia annua TaxID=35608 RepID=A0A2U1QIF0_ARTAN|nr:myc-type, basic helix-loop-helix (bHLH) domain-containing protein [Artemisia annua]
MKEVEVKEVDTEEEGKRKKERAAKVDIEPEAVPGIGFGKDSGTEVMSLVAKSDSAYEGGPPADYYYSKSYFASRFVELGSTLEPDQSATTDRLAIIGDVIRVLNQLKSEFQECKEMNEKLLEEIKTFRAEMVELRKE